jgi:hypothetical protein
VNRRQISTSEARICRKVVGNGVAATLHRVRRLLLLAVVVAGVVAYREWRIRALEAEHDPDRPA